MYHDKNEKTKMNKKINAENSKLSKKIFPSFLLFLPHFVIDAKKKLT